MKRRSAGIIPLSAAAMMLLAALVSAAAAGCFSSRPAPKNPPVEQIAASIARSVDVSKMRPGDAAKLKKLYGIDADRLDGFILYTAPSNVEADEIAVFKARDDAGIDDVRSKISARIDSQAASFRDYLPEQYFLIQKHVLKTDGRYVLLAISKDAASIEKVFDDSLK